MDIAQDIRRTFETRADHQAIEFRGAWVTWGQIARFAEALEQLLADAGVTDGGRVGLVVRNRAWHAAAMLALLSRRRSMSLVYSMLSGPALAAEIGRLGAQAVIADVQDWPALQAACAAAGSAGVAIGGADFLPAAVAGLERTSLADADPGESQVEVLSSGTTGPPKRLPMPFRILDRAVESALQGESQDGPPAISAWPLSGIGGLVGIVALGVRGARLVLLERFSPHAYAEAVKRYRPTVLALPPTAIQMILDAQIPREDLASVTAIYGGSAHMDPDVQDRFEAAYGAPIYMAMGATEFCGTTVRWTPQMRRDVGDSKRGSVGKAMPGVTLRVADPETGALIDDGRPGLMEVLCPAVQPGWVRTTDLISIDADGYVFHHGRHDGAIVRGGFKIQPETITAALRTHPAVRDAATVGLAEPRLGAVPAAMVELHPGQAVSETALKEHLRDQLPSTHIPVRIAVVDELPRTTSLKVSLGDVREQLAAGSGRPA